jgi:hypothetical protein
MNCRFSDENAHEIMLRSQRMSYRILLVLPLLGVIFLLPRLFLWAQMSLTFVAWPWQFDLAEGVNLDATVQLAQGHNIYAHNGPDAFTSAPYTPLFYLINLPSTWLFGPSFGFGRAISMLATLAIALLLFYVVRVITSSWSSGLLAGAIWLSVSPVIVWSALFTQSTLAPALGFAGLAMILRYMAPKRVAGAGRAAWPLYAGVVLFALAFYAKQTALDAAAATLVWLLIRDPKRGTQAALSLAGLLVVPFFSANVALRGGLWEKVISDHALSWNAGRAWRIGGRLWYEYWPLVIWADLYLVGSLAGLAWFVRARKSWAAVREALGTPWALALFYFVFATASVLARIGGDGINYNHLIDLVLPLCLLAGLSTGWSLDWLGSRIAARSDPLRTAGASHMHPRSERGYVSALGGLAIAAILMGAQLLQFTDPHTWYSGMWPSAAREAQMNALSTLVASTPGDILSDDAYLLLHNGRRDLYDDTFMLVSLRALGHWDDAAFVQSLRDRRFSLLFLFDLDRWSPTERQALSDDYSLKFHDILSTYSPLVTPASPQYGLTCKLSNTRDSLALQGYSLAPGVASDGIARGQVLRTTLYWRPASQPKGDYASFLHLVDDQGQSVASQDNPHTGAASPTTQWKAGSVVTDTASIPIPAGLAPGAYRLVAGMYSADPSTGKLQSLPASCASGETYGDAVSLGPVEIK